MTDDANFKPVSRDAFFAEIYSRKLDVHPSIVTKWPYTSIWNFQREPHKPPFGKSVIRLRPGNFETDYFVRVAP